MCGNRAYYISVVSLEMRYNTFWSSFVCLTCHFLLFYINFLTCISFFIAAFSIGKIVFFVKKRLLLSDHLATSNKV